MSKASTHFDVLEKYPHLFKESQWHNFFSIRTMSSRAVLAEVFHVVQQDGGWIIQDNGVLPVFRFPPPTLQHIKGAKP